MVVGIGVIFWSLCGGFGLTVAVEKKPSPTFSLSAHHPTDPVGFQQSNQGHYPIGDSSDVTSTAAHAFNDLTKWRMEQEFMGRD